MERFIIESKAPATTPIDWYHVGVRDTLEEAEEAVARHVRLDNRRNCKCCPGTEYRIRDIEL